MAQLLHTYNGQQHIMSETPMMIMMKKKRTTVKADDFETRIKTMKASELVMAMVEGLRKPRLEVNMGAFGATIRRYPDIPEKPDVICVGCAASNAICEIAGRTYKPAEVGLRWDRAGALGVSEDALYNVEYGFNQLRLGKMESAGFYFQAAGMKAELGAYYPGKLPTLDTVNYKARLKYYATYAAWLAERGQ